MNCNLMETTLPNAVVLMRNQEFFPPLSLCDLRDDKLILNIKCIYYTQKSESISMVQCRILTQSVTLGSGRKLNSLH